MKKVLLLFSIFACCFGSSTGTLSTKFMNAKGVLIHPKVVLTSAHVLQGRSGVTFNNLYKGTAFCHPCFKKNSPLSIERCKYDIALFILDRAVLDMPYISLSTKAQEALIWVDNRAATFGDSGSPLIVDGRVLAIASAISGENKDNYLVVYTSVYPHLNWIEKILEENI